MIFKVAIFFVLKHAICMANTNVCDEKCPPEDGAMTCGFNAANSSYIMFPSKCAFTRYKECYKADIAETLLKFCIKAQKQTERKNVRNMYGESCPVFCPSHYRPVCAVNTLMSYVYRTFVNGCQLDIVNCRGNDMIANYVEVPLSYCSNHLMKNIFQEQMVMSNIKEYHDYNE